MSEEPMTFQNLGGDKITTRAPVAKDEDVGELVRRLRDGQDGCNPWQKCWEAADIIDSLTAREAALREALSNLMYFRDHPENNEKRIKAVEAARAVLARK